MSRTMETVNILVLVSGGGSNLQALIDAEKENAFTKGGECSGKIALIISDREGVYALERAAAAGVPSLVLKPDYKLPRTERREKLSCQILQHCREKNIGLIVFAGFLSVLAGDIVNEYSGRMINIHPALLPKYGGQGMYGEHVHRSVLEAGETESGCTVHLVEAGIDTGPILLQRKVTVLPGDDARSLAERIIKEEHIAIVEAVKIMIWRKHEKAGAC